MDPDRGSKNRAVPLKSTAVSCPFVVVSAASTDWVSRVPGRNLRRAGERLNAVWTRTLWVCSSLGAGILSGSFSAACHALAHARAAWPFSPASAAVCPALIKVLTRRSCSVLRLAARSELALVRSVFETLNCSFSCVTFCCSDSSCEFFSCSCRLNSSSSPKASTDDTISRVRKGLALTGR
jgi:hypothetical protein